MYLLQFAGRALAAAALFLSLSLTVANAEAPRPAPSPDLPEIGRVTTSDRHDEPLSRTSRPTFVVDRARMEARGDRTIADALWDVPGVQLFRYGAFGAQANYGLRGSTSAQTLVLLDGEPLQAASNGILDLGSFSTIGVRRIEVVEGGASTLYGTSAVGGVINIITGIPRGQYMALATGTRADRDARIAVGNGSLGLGFERHVASNVYDYTAVDGLKAPGTRTNADAESSAGRVVYDGPIAPTWRLHASAGGDAIHLGVPGNLNFGTTPDARQNTSRSDVRADATRSTARSAFTVSLSGSRQNLVYRDPSTSFGGESATYDGRSQLALRDVVAGARSTLLFGVDLARESAKLDLGPSGPPPQFSAAQAQSAAYAQYEYDVRPGSRLYVGLRGENDAPQGSVLAPAGGGILALGTVRLAVNVAESFRVPTLIDLYYPGFSNPDLKPEKSRNTDLTVQAPTLLGGVSLGWFGREATNLIILNEKFVPQNAQHASIQGLMLTAQTRPRNGIVTALSVTNLYRAVDRSPGAHDARLPFKPTFSATLSLTSAIPTAPFTFGFDAQVMGPHVEGRALRNGETVVDVYTRYRLVPAGVLTVRVRNLGNERYAPIAGYPAPGRAVEVEVSTR